MFAVFDENKSWYLDYNIRSYCDRSRVNRADQDFYKSNVMHSEFCYNLLFCGFSNSEWKLITPPKTWAAFFCNPSTAHKANYIFYWFLLAAINGYVFESGQILGFCNGEVVTWHMTSIGAQDYIQTATFYGHTFELNDRTEDLLSLYPMTGETISMNMENKGLSGLILTSCVQLFASLNMWSAVILNKVNLYTHTIQFSINFLNRENQ